MAENEQPIDWTKTSFEGSRREQLRRAQAMSVRQRLEAMDQLSNMSERMRAMSKDGPFSDASKAARESHIAYGTKLPKNDIVLEGCTPAPLANYLKALGVLRLLSKQYPKTRGFWRNDHFVLRTSLGCDDIKRFFLDHYKPSALVTPWNGRGGFLEGDDGEETEDGSSESTRAGALMVRTFSDASAAERFSSLRATLNAIASIDGVARLNSARAELKRLKVDEKTKGKRNLSGSAKEALKKQEAEARDAKTQLLQALRNGLTDDVLTWFDACLSLVSDPKNLAEKRATPSPLLGAGGLDGSMDFGVNYLKRVNDVFDPFTGHARHAANEWLDAALFGTTIDKLISKSLQDKKRVSVGQFSPYNAGGYNTDNGFTGEALLNPWDTILQLEGSVLFAASTVRRLEGSGNIHASLPFTVEPSASGNAVTLSDESPKGAKRRTAEAWLPLWRQPTTSRELEAIFQEGRITLHGRPVTNGFDVVRALASLGASRGISGFQRYAFLKRSGDAFFALDCGRFNAKDSKYSSFIDDLEGNHFLTRLHSFVRSKTASGEWKAGGGLRIAALRLDSLIVQVLRDEDRRALSQAFLLLGQIQKLVADSSVARQEVPPVPNLSANWVATTDDGSRAFRIAKALAGLRGEDNVPLPLRAHLFPVQSKSNQWMTPKSEETVRLYTGQKGRLTATLRTVFERRLWLTDKMSMKSKPLFSPAGVTLEDAAAFLHDDRMDTRIAALLPSLCLCNIPKDEERSREEGSLPAAFGLLKLALTPDHILRSLHRLGEEDRLPIPAGMLAQLATGNRGNRAVKTAWRRLRSAGLTPALTAGALPSLQDIEPTRAIAALLIPLCFEATKMLALNVLGNLNSETKLPD